VISIPYLDIFLILACAGFYYKAAEFENTSGIFWASLSLATYFLTWQLFRWAPLGNLLGQAALLGAITLVRVLGDYRKTR
jgi:hypothetical protein